MFDFRRALLLSLLAAASCEAGPTSDWPGEGSQNDEDGDDDEGQGPPRGDAGSVGSLDSSIGRVDASVPIDDGDCVPDAGDAGDAGCVERDF